MNITKLSAGISCLIFFFISSIALAETSLEITNCKGNVAEITTSHIGFWAEMDGGGDIYVKWENIKKITAQDCNPDLKIEDPILCSVTLSNGEEQNANIAIFYTKDKKGTHHLTGQMKLGEFSIEKTKIKQIVVQMSSKEGEKPVN